MGIGLPVNRPMIDGRATDLAQQWESLIGRTAEFYAKVSGELHHDGLVNLPGGGYSDVDNSGAEPGEDEADSMVRASNYFGDLVKHYRGEPPWDFNYSDALKIVRGLGR